MSNKKEYKIEYIEDLKRLRDKLERGKFYFEDEPLFISLMQDLDFEAEHCYRDFQNYYAHMVRKEEGQSFKAISVDRPIIFNGNDFIIRNLYSINQPEAYAGLFCDTYGATSIEIHNLSIEKAKLHSRNGTTGLITQANGVTINNCHFDGEVSGKNCVGSFIGSCFGRASISNSDVSVKVNGRAGIGYLIGNAHQYEISTTTITGKIKYYDESQNILHNDNSIDLIVGWGNGISRVNDVIILNKGHQYMKQKKYKGRYI